MTEAPPCLLCASTASEVVALSPTQMSPLGGVFSFRRCKQCELVYLSPRPQAMAIAPYYEDYLPHRGGAAWGRFAELVDRAQTWTDGARVRLAKGAYPLKPGDRALDLGCGKPTFLSALRASTGAECVGVDFSPGAFGEGPWPGITLVDGITAQVPLEGKFQLITLWHALEHEYDPLAVLRRVEALLAPGGAVVIEVPNYDSWTRKLHGPHWAGWHTPRHTVAFTPKSLGRALEQANLDVERIRSHGTLDPYVLYWLGREEAKGRPVVGDLEPRFAHFMAGKILTMPLVLLQSIFSLGIMTAIARSKS